jgi:dTDP-4-dehydrorhamnose reductase
MQHFEPSYHSKILVGVDVLDQDSLVSLFDKVRPDILINCIGLIKQLSDANDPLNALPINSLLPHRLDRLCSLTGARFVHVSTDCVFSGDKGQYVETDVSDAVDLYGKSKYIGEIHNSKSTLTLRTSIIGHELDSSNALLEWFLSQENDVKGFSKAVFSGLPTTEFARVIQDYVIPNKNLNGLYHLSVEPIDKYSLLTLIAEIYNKDVKIISCDSLSIDRSLDSSRFFRETGYSPPSWNQLIEQMKLQSKSQNLKGYTNV